MLSQNRKRQKKKVTFPNFLKTLASPRLPAGIFYNTQPLKVNKMRLRSGIKTPSAEESLRLAALAQDGTLTPKPDSSLSSSKPNPSPRKRKAEPVEVTKKYSEKNGNEEESDDEIANLEGALSASEDDSDYDVSENEDEDESDDDDDDELDGDDDASDKEDDDEDALHSDDIPSDEEESSHKILPLRPGQVPGLDPEGIDNGDEDLRNYRVETDANGNEKYVYDEIDPVYDSDDTDANEPVNTIGNIDLKFYDSYPHIGYDINGKKIMRPAAGDALDALLDSIEIPKGWTGLTDPTTGKPLNLSQNELELIKKIQMNELPQGFDPYPVRFVLITVVTSYLLTAYRKLSNGLLAMRRLCL